MNDPIYDAQYAAGFQQGSTDYVARAGAYLYGEHVNKSDAWRDGYKDAYAEHRAARHA